jgi:hypothetical protein
LVCAFSRRYFGVSSPQAKQRKETVLAEKVENSERFGCTPAAALKAEAPRHAGISAKKKGPEKFRALALGAIER